MTDAQLTGSIPHAWFDSLARKAAAQALLPTIHPQHSRVGQLTRQQQAPDAAGQSVHVEQLSVPPATVHVLQQAAAASSKPGMATGLTQLQELRLAGNRLNGSVSGIELLSSLRVLDLSSNGLGGQLPVQLATLSKLQVSCRLIRV
jgi:Leucine-rich repeat (LRR) protein